MNIFVSPVKAPFTLLDSSDVKADKKRKKMMKMYTYRGSFQNIHSKPREPEFWSCR